MIRQTLGRVVRAAIPAGGEMRRRVTGLIAAVVTGCLVLTGLLGVREDPDHPLSRQVVPPLWGATACHPLLSPLHH